MRRIKQAWEAWDPMDFADIAANVGPWILVIIFLAFVVSAL